MQYGYYRELLPYLLAVLKDPLIKKEMKIIAQKELEQMAEFADEYYKQNKLNLSERLLSKN